MLTQNENIQGEISETPTDFSIYTCVELREKLKRLRLIGTGNKAALIQRLQEYVAENGSGAISLDDEQHVTGDDNEPHESGENHKNKFVISAVKFEAAVEFFYC